MESENFHQRNWRVFTKATRQPGQLQELDLLSQGPTFKAREEKSRKRRMNFQVTAKSMRRQKTAGMRNRLGQTVQN